MKKAYALDAPDIHSATTREVSLGRCNSVSLVVQVKPPMESPALARWRAKKRGEKPAIDQEALEKLRLVPLLC